MTTDIDNPALNWHVEFLRVTCFHNREIRPAEDPWEKAVGHPPDQIINRREEGAIIQEGLWDKGKLGVKQKRIRTDWVYYQSHPAQSELPCIGLYGEVAPPFYKLVRDQLIEGPDLSRLALGMILLRPVENRREGYEILDQLLPDVTIDVENSSDFLYQINRPRPLVVGELSLDINRLSKWSIFMSQVHELEMAMFSEKQMPKPVMIHSKHACRLELDINNSQNPDLHIPPETLPDIFDTIIRLSEEIATKGDL